MRRQHPIQSAQFAVLRKFRRIMTWIALFSLVISTIAVLLVIRGDEGPHIRLMVGIALGSGVSVLVAGAAMSLAFLRAGSGQEPRGEPFRKDEKN